MLLLLCCWIIAGIRAEITPAMHYREKHGSICLHIKSPKHTHPEWLFEKDIIAISKIVTAKFKGKVRYYPNNSSLCITELNETDSGLYTFSFVNSNQKRSIETHTLHVEETVPTPFIQLSKQSLNLSVETCNTAVNCSVQDDWLCSVCDINSCITSQRSLFSKVNITIFLHHNTSIVCSGNNNVSKSNVSASIEGMCLGTPPPESPPKHELYVIVIGITFCVCLCTFAVWVAKMLFPTEYNLNQTSPALTIQPAVVQQHSAQRVSSSSSSQAEAFYENVDAGLPCQSPNISSTDEPGSKKDVNTLYSVLQTNHKTSHQGKNESSEETKGHQVTQEQPVQVDTVYSLLQKPRNVKSQHHQ
ncbi:hypothetical protein PBY51_002745 [Eleginops maclovinus]|uniref:Uncharacterized protein n=2 Tax=Eleginops maclovinus TaxID=56733 RepID=A0AAN7X8V0_ELEMC|nr:hypothetical protein PBY51_002745 [Eleginops maclovinus]